jgi:pyruvate formate lyase activating enzyme
MTEIDRTPPETLLRAHDIARAAGLRYVYTGNIHHERTGTTYCHGCGTAVIGRDWHEITAWKLDGSGNCLSCGAPCAGVFDGPPGDWGRQRRPVRMNAAAPARSA